ncbi:MAG: DciA family protein [Planctomycetota bacterium]|jgi:hypothetical protein
MGDPKVKRRRSAVPVGDLIPGALRALGMPSARLTGRLVSAWEAAIDPAWRSETRLEALTGGVLIVNVESASLRQELAQFHAARLLSVLRLALPDVSIVRIRFQAGGVEASGTAGEER